MPTESKKGGVLLRRWLRDERRSQEWLGEQIGTHQTNVSAWLRGRDVPLDMALAIHKVTGIAVEDWTVPAEDESERVLVDDGGAKVAV